MIRRTLSIIVCVLAATIIAGGASGSVSLVSNLKMDDKSSGAVADRELLTDYSGNENDGLFYMEASVVGGVSQWISQGASGNAIRLAGTSGNSHGPIMPGSTVIDTLLGDFSVELWLNLAGASPDSKDTQVLLWTQTPGTTDVRFDLRIAGPSRGADAGKLRLFWDYGKGTTVMSYDVWHQVVMTVDRGSSTGVDLKVYLDGLLEINSPEYPLSMADNLAATGLLHSGYAYYYANILNGSVDEFRLYSGVLSPEQVQYNYSNPGNPLNPPVPEPASVTTIGVGFLTAALGVVRRRRR